MVSFENLGPFFLRRAPLFGSYLNQPWVMSLSHEAFLGACKKSSHDSHQCIALDMRPFRGNHPCSARMDAGLPQLDSSPDISRCYHWTFEDGELSCPLEELSVEPTATLLLALKNI